MPVGQGPTGILRQGAKPRPIQHSDSASSTIRSTPKMLKTCSPFLRRGLVLRAHTSQRGMCAANSTKHGF
jgi:hypothetical protein